MVETSDGELVDVEKGVATKMSLAIRKKIESAGPNGVIQLDNITARALSKVMEYCHMHTAPHIVTMEKGMDLKTWDERFVKLDPGTLCELASAAYHLQIKPLVDLTCQAIAQLLKGKTPAEIRRTFNILYDFQPEDDAPPPTMRDKLRNKLCNPKRKEQKTKALPPPPEPVDTRSVDDLVSFINDGKNNTAASSVAKTKSKSSKKARQRERKKKSRSSQERERDGLRTSQEKVSNGMRTSQELTRGNLRSSQEKTKTKGGNQQEDRTTREKRERREDIIQRIINMQRVNEDSEGEFMRSNSTSPSPSFSSTSSSPVSSSPSSTSSSPLSSPLSSPSHSRNPSGNSSDLFFHSSDDKARRDNGFKFKEAKLKQETYYLPPNQPNQRRTSSSSSDSVGSPIPTTPETLSDSNRDPLEISLDDDIWQEEEDDDMDPELKAQQDREVEEFRRRLEQVNNTVRC
jgi:S-phase kinase-associated protein 1